MDNIILGTSLACVVGVAAAFRADLRALRARERAMRQGTEFSWGPDGHEVRVVLPGLRRPKSPRSSRAGSRRPCLSSRPCFSCSSGSVGRLIVSLLAWCAPAAGGAVLRNAPTHRPRKWSGSSWSRARAGSCARSEHPASLWNSPGRCTVPSMSRHGLVTTLRTKSRLRRWFASTRPINCGIAARCDAAHKKSPLEPRVRAGSGSTQATDEAALSYRALTRGDGRRGGLTRRGTPNSVKEITPFSVQVYKGSCHFDVSIFAPVNSELESRPSRSQMPSASANDTSRRRTFSGVTNAIEPDHASGAPGR